MGSQVRIVCCEVQEGGRVYGCQRAQVVDLEDYDDAAQKTVHGHGYLRQV